MTFRAHFGFFVLGQVSVSNPARFSGEAQDYR